MIKKINKYVARPGCVRCVCLCAQGLFDHQRALRDHTHSLPGECNPAQPFVDTTGGKREGKKKSEMYGH